MTFDPKSLLAFYRSEHRIFGTCPHCNEPFRLSEVKLTYGAEPPRDVVSKLKRQRDQLENELADVKEEIDSLETEHQRELDDRKLEWSAKIDGEVEKRLAKAVRDIRKAAINRSHKVTLGKIAEKLAPLIPGFGYDFSDVRPMFEPVDFIVFDGLAEKRVDQVVFVEFKTGNGRPNETQESIMDAVNDRRVKFEVIRLSEGAVNRARNRVGASRLPLLEAAPSQKPGTRGGSTRG